MLCVECGREVEETIDGSCATCLHAKQALLVVPPHVDVVLCAHCGARQVGAHWHQPEEGAPEQWMREDAVRVVLRLHPDVEDPIVEIDEIQKDQRHFETTVRLEGRLAGEDVEEAQTLLVRQGRSVCDRCSRIAGGYFAAIIQLRATERDVTPRELDLAHRLIAEDLDRGQSHGNRFAFLAKSGPMHGGFDYYVGDIDAARNACRILSHRLGASVTESPKLVGRRDGQDLYRVTFLVRVALLAPGDFVLRDDTPYEVHSVARGKVTCMDLRRRQRTRIMEKGLKRLGGPELLEEAVVVSSDPHTIQVLDPSSLRTVDVARPPDMQPGETVLVLRLEDELVLPEYQRATTLK